MKEQERKNGRLIDFRLQPMDELSWVPEAVAEAIRLEAQQARREELRRMLREIIDEMKEQERKDARLGVRINRPSLWTDDDEPGWFKAIAEALQERKKSREELGGMLREMVDEFDEFIDKL